MREYSTPPSMDPPTSGNLTDDVVRNAAEAPGQAVFSRPDGAGGWADITAAQFLADVRAAAKGLVAAGVERGDRVALISRTRYEWTLLDYAIWFAGAVTVPVYETSSAEQIGWILQDSGARAVVAEGPEHVARINEVRSDLTDLNHVWSFADNAVEILGRLGGDVSDDELEKRRTKAGPGDLATLIYTSGTTGRPKGCMLTHGNFMVELGVAVPELDALFESEDASTLLFLPLAHVFARIIQVGCVRSRTRMAHSGDAKRLPEDLKSLQPTFVLAVPRVFEKVFNTASQRATADGRGGVFDRAAETAIAYSRGLDKGRPSLLVRAQHAAFSRLGLRAAARGAGRTLRVRRLRRSAAGRAARPLLPRHRPHRPRGLRPDGDDGCADREPPRRDQGRQRRPSPPRHVRAGGRGRGAPLPRGPGLHRLLAQRRRQQRGARRRRLVPHGRRRRDRRRGLRPDHRTQEGDPGDRRRQERRPRRARGPHPCAPAGRPVPGGR